MYFSKLSRLVINIEYLGVIFISSPNIDQYCYIWYSHKYIALSIALSTGMGRVDLTGLTRSHKVYCRSYFRVIYFILTMNMYNHIYVMERKYAFSMLKNMFNFICNLEAD